MKVDEEVTAVILAVLVVVGIFTISRTVFAGRVVDPFSEIAVLSPNKTISDYPKELVVGEAFNLFLYLGNHEGRVMYYRVLVKLGDQASNVSDAQPLDAPVLAFIESILMHGGNQTIPVILSLGEAGINQRLVFELDIYNQEMDSFQYHGRWCQLWFNVTQPPT